MTADPSSLVVVSAHAADFVWRCGGYIAKTTAAGGTVDVICLSFGERGESQGAWRQDGMTLEKVKEIRRGEASAAGEILGARMTFLDRGDYPLPDDDETLFLLVEKFRELQPAAILTHASVDPYNYDHPLAADLTMRARMVAQARGHDSSYPPLGAPPVFRFEPHQPEMCEFTPDVLVDITEVFDRKLQAMQMMGSQEHLVSYYTDLGVRRGVQAVRNGGHAGIMQAEAYQRVFPHIAEELR
jgi:4-oxalomesaconate hydratase